MKYFFALLLTATTLTASAQFSVYHPFPDSAAYWNIWSQGCCASNCSGPVINPVFQDFLFTYELNGDTSINGYTYHKMSYSGSIHEYCSMGGPLNVWNFLNNEYKGGLRQDTVLRQVYFILANETSECLLYDFNLSVGDTFISGCSWPGDCAEVISIDSVFAGNNYRKRFNLNTNPPYSLIEGIGSTSGLFEPLCPFEYYGELQCFFQDGQIIYSNGSGACNNYTGTQTTDDAVAFTAHPNPFRHTLNINVFGDMREGYWVLLNNMGMVIRQDRIIHPNFTIQNEHFAPGIYLLRIFNENKFSNSRQIIIE